MSKDEVQEDIRYSTSAVSTITGVPISSVNYAATHGIVSPVEKIKESGRVSRAFSIHDCHAIEVWYKRNRRTKEVKKPERQVPKTKDEKDRADLMKPEYMRFDRVTKIKLDESFVRIGKKPRYYPNRDYSYIRPWYNLDGEPV